MSASERRGVPGAPQASEPGGVQGAPPEIKRQAIATDKAPQAIGPYSQAIRAGSLLFVSGQVPIDPATGALIEGDIAAQTDRVMRNLSAILEAAGTSMDQVVRCTVYLADMNDFAAMNDVYGSYFSPPAPARATIQAVRLPKDARVEIDVIAMLARRPAPPPLPSAT